MKEIKKPLQTTYYIILNDLEEYVAHGVVEVNQEMRTGHPYLTIFTDEEELKLDLLNYGIDLDAETEEWEEDQIL
tara:strand:+ start:61 stop:285 length:225 start_codon:yes stop_codon:yes gene_type:complete